MWFELAIKLQLQGTEPVGFLEIFRGKYFSERVKEKKVAEFAALKQKGMSVAEYEAQFACLAVYAPHLVGTKRLKANRFMDGLRPMFIEKLGPNNIQNYTEMVQRAQLVEDTMAKVEGMRGKDNSKPIFAKRGAPNIAPTFCNNNNNKRPNAGRDFAGDKRVKVEGRQLAENCNSDPVLVRAIWRLLDQGGVIIHEIRNSSRRENYIGGGFGALEDGGEDCLTDEAGFFGLQIITLVAGKEASYMGVQFRICKIIGLPLWRLVDVEELARLEVMSQQAKDQTGVPLPPPPPPVDYGALMQGLVHAMETQAQTTAALQAQVQVQVQAPAQKAVFRGVPMIERFRRMTPPFFNGESDPILAESWLRETEKIFRAIRCAEEERVTLATYMLRERADVWWSFVLHTQFGDGAMEVAWTEFVHLFRAKYIPEHVQDRMKQEFLTLTQGLMSVLEYEAKFTELSKYAPHIVADERRKVKKFIMGLKPSLRTRLVALGHRSMEQALSVACM
ncbi:hypothetical protein Taro_009301 [Colocasia esculenta]|uniref:Retrotransposon gag domain-containing protein n=1 Tax=Colocasia esculenta TaxID=4460 RepID=A0A843U9K9_COLES|nr:hypothetical protein [Colocasia esculenta]